MSDSQFRLILDEPRRASLNMAIDEFFLENFKNQNPILRVYFWSEACYTIGYFQNLEIEKKKFNCEKKNMPIVRRITGGGLVRHGQDVTFSLVIPASSYFLPRDIKSSYLKINEALLSGFKEMYPKMDFADCRAVPSGRPGKDRVCFESPSCYDLMLSGKKVGGSSQRRKNGIVLHQSSLFLDEAKEVVGAKIIEGFSRKWGVQFHRKPLTRQELELAEKKEATRYSQADWAFPVCLAFSFLS